MASRGTASPITAADVEQVTNYDPIARAGGGTPATPKRYLNVGGTAVPIQ